MDSMSEKPITTEEILQLFSKKDTKHREYSYEFFQTRKIGHFYFSKLFQSTWGKWWMGFMHPNWFYKVHVLLTLKSDKDKVSSLLTFMMINHRQVLLRQCIQNPGWKVSKWNPVMVLPKEVRVAHNRTTPSVWYAFLVPRLVLGQNWTQYLDPGSLDPTFLLYSPTCSSQKAEKIKWSRCPKLAKNTEGLQFE